MVRANALNSVAQQSVYVNPQTGSDTAGNGSAMNPYATLGKANTSITDNATGKRYAIILTGIATETAVVIKPFVSIVGLSPNSARISVTGAGNHITLDASWTGGSTSNLENITLVSSTNLSFNTSAISGGGSQVSCFNVQAGSGATWLGRAAGSDILVLSQCGFGGNISITDANIDSSLNNIGGFSFLISTNATVQIFWVSQADIFNSDINITETSGQSTIAQFFNSSIMGQATVTGAAANIEYDAISYPQGGITFVSGGLSSRLIISPSEIIFKGASGTNNITVPNNLGDAFTILDEVGHSFLQADSTSATPRSIFTQTCVFSSGQFVGITSVAAATYVVTFEDYFLACNRAGAIALTFPTAMGSGRKIVIKDISGAASTNNITATSSGATFDGVATLTINTNYGSVTCTDTATNIWSFS